ncbi:MAG: sulfatase-like hydrolase/transferase [Akkermansiaceae bacterium]|nr:sulfatase-like hydrolase/transferase [Akkermansiaceae bacterium]
MKPILALFLLSSFAIASLRSLLRSSTRFAVLAVSLCSAPHSSFSAQPNILLFLADDLGYADIGANGCQDIPTPNVDSIAKNGVRFTDAYATHPVCSPSRAGLMSGMYQHRFGFEHNSGPERYASPDFGMPREIPSLAEKLKAAGYATGMFGKWHIGFKEGLRPHERGFDYHFGFLSGARSYYPDNPRENDPLIRNGKVVKGEKDYLTDAFAREAADFIERSKAQPWFVYLPFNAVHSPLEATEKYEARFPNITEKKRKTYAGMLSALDDAVGRVMAKVRELGQEENTLVMFYSDNGGPTFETTSRNDPLRGYKGQMYEGGIRVPFALQWKGKIPAGQTYREMIMGFDYHATALAAAGVEVPKDKPNDGVNLLPYLLGEKTSAPHDFLCWRAGAQRAIRMGDWKLVQTPRESTAQLFNLKTDLGETTDLAAKEPAKFNELAARFAEWERGTIPAKWIRQDQRNAEEGGKLKTGSTPKGTAKAGNRVDEAFKKADANQDGKLTREEYPQKEVFDAVDANKDGFATLEEVRGYYQTRRGQGNQ